MTPGLSRVINESPEGVFAVAYTRPLASPIILTVTVSEAGGTTATETVTIAPESAIEHLVRVGGAWV